jgi:hypothetical protein
MDIHIIKDEEEWDSFILKSPYGQIFHLWNFLKIVENHSQTRLFTYGIFNGEKLVALIPLFYQKRYGFRFIFSPPPKTAIPHLGMVLDNTFDTLNQHRKERLLIQMADKLLPELDTHAPNLVSISNPPDYIDLRPFIWKGYEVKPRYTYFLDLNSSLDNILKGFTRQRRQSIKNAESQGFEVQTGGDITDLYKGMENRYREQGLTIPLLGQNYLSDLYSAFPEYLKLYTVMNEGQKYGSILVTRFKDVKLWLGSGMVELLIWNIIKDAQRDGFSSCELVGANTKNLCKFKNQFNPHVKLYFGIVKRDLIGKLSESFYHHVMRKTYLP